MALRLTPDLIAEIHAYTSGVLRARSEYAAHPSSHVTLRCRCADTVSCQQCRRRARADLKVATSVTECADLLTVLDKRERRRAKPVCGTPSGYRAHLRLGEDACRDCRTAHNTYAADWSRRRKGRP